VLVAECNGAVHERLRRALSARGHVTATVALAELASSAHPPREVILTVGEDATESCRWLTAHVPSASVILVDETPQLARAIAAIRAGAADYAAYDDEVEAVEAAIRRVIERRELRYNLERLSSEAAALDSGPRLLGESEVLRAVRERLDRLRTSGATVLITGESGTGKEVAARILHLTSARRDGPFIAINCGAVPGQLVESEFFGHARGAFTDAGGAKEGLLVQASGGTLFLDEVGAMPFPVQAKLLRAIQERAVRPLGQGHEIPFDVRIIAATNVDLAEHVSAGQFRADLFFRLNVVPIRMPPLRDRGLDTLLLAQHFLRRFAAMSGKRVVGMTLGAARALMRYRWPGNVRELSNWMEGAVALTRRDHVTESELLPNVRGAVPAAVGEKEARGAATAGTLARWEDLEARHIVAVLEDVAGNKARAARLLGIDRKTLYRKLRRYGLPTLQEVPSRSSSAE
jgi:two-component system response regulator HydG